MFNCRIGKITYKKPLLAVIEPAKRSDYRALMHEHVDKICDIYNSTELAGYYLVGVGFDGGYSLGWRLNKEAPFGVTMLSALLKEIISRDLVATEAALDVINDRVL